METKFCRKCCRVLPISDFSIDTHMYDAHACYCKDCINKATRARREVTATALSLGRNPKLVKFTTEELMEELSARLQYTLTQ